MPASAQTYRRVQVCPVGALAAVSAEARNRIPERFRPLLPAPTGALDISPCPPEALARLEAWLLSTRGVELSKAKSFDKALQSVAHVTYVWLNDEAAQRVDGAVRRWSPAPPAPKPETYRRQLVLPSACFAGHLIGRGGRWIRPLLARCPEARVRFERGAVSITGSRADVKRVAQELEDMVVSQLHIARKIAEGWYETEDTYHHAEDLSYNLEREREYRERNVQRKRGGRSCARCAPVTQPGSESMASCSDGMGWTNLDSTMPSMAGPSSRRRGALRFHVRSAPREFNGSKRTKNDAKALDDERAMRAGRCQRKAHPRLQQRRPGCARGGRRVGTTGKCAAMELRERLTDLFC